jgi:hypothetical protein
MCTSYQDADLMPSSLPDLGWQSRLTRLVQVAKPVLAPATRADIIRTLAKIAPIAITGTGPTHRDRTCSGLSFRKKGA